MLFNSFEFLIFFPVVVLLFFLLPHRFRTYLLLAASCIFYCYFIPLYLLILVFIILVDYFAGINIERSRFRKKTWLVLSISMNIGLLAVFKYYNFFISNANHLFGTSATLLNFILPVGLSFHTFQAMAYTIEVYRGNVPAEKNIFRYGLYVLFFPQLVAGPIERPQHLLPQFYKKQYFNSDNLLEGLRLMVWGFFKKLVIADNLSGMVDMVFKAPETYKWYIVITTIFFFSIQIYCDFSGYTDIARGAAKIMGIDLMINFNRPLLAKSISDFWKRWHISLSSWFRDYVYIPLGGSRKTKSRLWLNLLIVFSLSGFWHGAAWHFVTWGLLHCLFLIIASLLFKKNIFRNELLRKITGIITVNILVAYSFVFFRASSVSNAVSIIKASFNIRSRNAVMSSFPLLGNYLLSFILFFILFMFVFESKQDPSLKKMSLYPARDVIFFTLISLIIIFWGVFSRESFIYFQF